MIIYASNREHYNDLRLIKSACYFPSHPIPFIIDVVLCVTALIFMSCSLRFLTSMHYFNEKSTNKLPIYDSTNNYAPVSSRKYYYDYERYLDNISLKETDNTRRYFYVDLGCFDGRDIDYFTHFHSETTKAFGSLSIIAFEPDPINFAACRITQERHRKFNGTVYNTAAWIQNGHVQYVIEKGQKSKVDLNSPLRVQAIDFSKWLLENFSIDDYVYVKFTVEGVEIPILEKMVLDQSLLLVDYLDIEWHEQLSKDFEIRRIVLECMFDNFGLDYLYMINPVDLKHAFNSNETFAAVPKDKGWKLNDSFTRFYYKTRTEVRDLLVQKLKQQDLQKSSI